MPRKISIAFILLSAVFLSSCVINPTITGLNTSYAAIRSTVIHNLPGGLKNQSPNGRELRSFYYLAQDRDKYILLDDEKSESAPERDFTKVVILGDRRPYSVEVRVYRQKLKRGSKRYATPSLDDDLTADMGQRIREALANRREDSNVIDDFRAF